MRVKPLPEPPDDLDGVWEARRAVPLVPKAEADCCARVMDRAGVRNRDEAGRWLSFLRGLGLVEEGERGFARTREEVDPDRLAAAFRERVFGAAEVLETLAAADGAVTADEAFERFAEHVPGWERRKHSDWREVWRDRTGRLLEWLVLLGLAERADGGYRHAPRG